MTMVIDETLIAFSALEIIGQVYETPRINIFLPCIVSIRIRLHLDDVLFLLLLIITNSRAYPDIKTRAKVDRFIS